MSRRKRNDYGQFAKAPSKKMLFGSWLASFVSLALLWATAAALWSDLSSFRSCDANSGGLTLTSCGKHGLNAGDTILLGLFLLAGAMAFSMCTHAYRMTKRTIPV